MGSASSSQSKPATGAGARSAHGGGDAAPSSSEAGHQRARRANGEHTAADFAVEEEVPEACDDCDHCKFMMGGACRDQYVRSRRCSMEAELAGLDPVEDKRCLRAGAALLSCITAHQAYYRPYIRALEERYEEEQELEARRVFDYYGARAEEV